MTAEMRSNHLKSLARWNENQHKKRNYCVLLVFRLLLVTEIIAKFDSLLISLSFGHFVSSSLLSSRRAGRSMESSAEHISLPAAKLLKMKRNEAKLAFIRNHRKWKKHACSHERTLKYPLLATVLLLFLFHFHQNMMKQFLWLLLSRAILRSERDGGSHAWITVTSGVIWWPATRTVIE